MASPDEWEECRLVIASSLERWHCLELRRNGDPMELFVEGGADERRLVARWPRSGAGHYELVLEEDGGSTLERVLCLITPRRLEPSEVQDMLESLQRRLPASIAIALQRGGALAGMEVVPPDESTLAEEVLRLGRAIDGTTERAGLVSVLSALADRPHRVLQAGQQWTERYRAKRVDPSRLVQAFSRPGNLDAGGLPILVPERPALQSCDVYENRLLKLFHRQVDMRLRAVIQAFDRRGDDGSAARVRLLQHRLALARRKASFLDDVRDLSEPPSRTTMVLSKVMEYRAALDGFLELNRRALVRLYEPGVDAPLENLPFLYQSWGVLEVVAAALEIAEGLGYTVRHESLTMKIAGEPWIRVLRDGAPAVILDHPSTGALVEIIPQRRYRARAGRLRSVSFDQIPDLAVEITHDQRTQVWLFDPKYKLLTDGDTAGRPKKVDIDAMHAYRDAIRTPTGTHVVTYAAILYPGRHKSYGPGLAALSARPMNPERLRAAIRDVLGPPLARAAENVPTSYG